MRSQSVIPCEFIHDCISDNFDVENEAEFAFEALSIFAYRVNINSKMLNNASGCRPFSDQSHDFTFAWVNVFGPEDERGFS